MSKDLKDALQSIRARLGEDHAELETLMVQYLGRECFACDTMANVQGGLDDAMRDIERLIS